MKLSTYGFKDLSRTYSVVQFEDEESGAIVDYLKKTRLESLREELSRVLGTGIRELGLARGELAYESQVLEMAYLRIATEDNEEYVMEIYRDSGTIITNVSAAEAHSNIIKIFKSMCPKIKTPRTRIIGFG